MGREFSSDATLALRRAHVDPAAVAHERRQRRSAARAIAGAFAHDAADCALLLDALGLTAGEGKSSA
jgi:hypothetical protein